MDFEHLSKSPLVIEPDLEVLRRRNEHLGERVRILMDEAKLDIAIVRQLVAMRFEDGKYLQRVRGSKGHRVVVVFAHQETSA